jgi:hypothetical protein
MLCLGRSDGATGPWLCKVLSALALPLTVVRQGQLRFEPKGRAETFLPDRFLVWICGTKDGTHPHGLPAWDAENGGVKVSLHDGGKTPAVHPTRLTAL